MPRSALPKTLTAKTIDALPPAVGKRYEVRDKLTPGLLLRVSHSGFKVFYVCKRVNGHMKRFKIGPYPILSFHDAREKARELLRNIELGRFIEKAPHEEEQRTPTLAEVIPQFIELYAKLRTRDWHGTERVLLKFSSLYSRPIDTVKRADIVRILDAIVASGTPSRAKRALAAFKKLMNWCVDRGVIEQSPVAQLGMPAQENTRDRVLTQEEIRLCWEMAAGEGYPFAPCVWLLMLTGQRRGEVSGMRWSELYLDNAIWTLPARRVRNKTLHTVPLSQLALEIIRSLPRYEGSDYVFTTTGTTPISGFGRLKERLDAAFGSDREDWRFHDLRRTCATNLAMLRFQPHIIEAVLNHKLGTMSRVAAVYNRHAYLDEKREALEAWANRVREIVSGPSEPRRTEAAVAGPVHQQPAPADHQSQSAS